MRRNLGAAQRRYGLYMQRIVTPTALPAWRDRCLKVSNVVIYAYDALKAATTASQPPEKPARPGSARSQPSSRAGSVDITHTAVSGKAMLVIFQRGLVVWANRATAEASI